MDFEIVWSPEAIEDIESIAEYIARDSEQYARSVVTEIVSVGRKISEFPKLGRVLPELEDESIRERFVYSYRIVYKLESERVLILAVIHGKRLIEHMQDRLNG